MAELIDILGLIALVVAALIAMGVWGYIYWTFGLFVVSAITWIFARLR